MCSIHKIISRLCADTSLRTVLIDGQSGAGKTTLATELSKNSGWPILHVEDMYPTWHGLADGMRIVAEHVLRKDNPGYRRFDWYNYASAEWVSLELIHKRIIEGVGAITPASVEAARALGEVLTVRIDAPSTVRKSRVFSRDSSAVEWWDQWAAQEEAMYCADSMNVDVVISEGSEVQVPFSDKFLRISAVLLCNAAGEVVEVRKAGTSSFMMPGGKHEPRESGVDAAIREISEELGIDLELSELYFFGHYVAPAANEPGLDVLCDVFLCTRILDSLPHVYAEIAEARWCSVDPQNEEERTNRAPLSADVVFPLVKELWHRKGIIARWPV